MAWAVRPDSEPQAIAICLRQTYGYRLQRSVYWQLYLSYYRRYCPLFCRVDLAEVVCNIGEKCHIDPDALVTQIKDAAVFPAKNILIRDTQPREKALCFLG